MIIRNALLLATVTFAGGNIAHAQTTTTTSPPGQSMQGMGNMPGMSGGASPDMAATMKQCAQMKAQMRAGMKMTPDMQPMMDHCAKMNASVGVAKAPDDTLLR